MPRLQRDDGWTPLRRRLSQVDVAHVAWGSTSIQYSIPASSSAFRTPTARNSDAVIGGRIGDQQAPSICQAPNVGAGPSAQQRQHLGRSTAFRTSTKCYYMYLGIGYPSSPKDDSFCTDRQVHPASSSSWVKAVFGYQKALREPACRRSFRRRLSVIAQVAYGAPNHRSSCFPIMYRPEKQRNTVYSPISQRASSSPA